MAAKKTTKKSAAKKTVTKKTAAKAGVGKKTVAKNVASKVAAVPPAEAKKTGRIMKPLTGEIGKNKHFTKTQLRVLRDRLLQLRERVSGEILSISQESLGSVEQDHSLSDQGTDTFDREFALNQLSNEQDVLFEIDEAIRRIENGTYGVCEMSGEVINIERLEALPYVRYTTTAQQELEKGQKKYREFGHTIHGY